MSKFPRLTVVLGLFLGVATPALGAGDPDAGKTVFRKCTACHQIGDGARNRVGPHLTGVIGRAAGAVDGFKYSKAMAEAGDQGLVWTEAALDAYLAAPRTALKGTRMAFAGLRKQQDRADVIAYMASASVSDAAAAKPSPAKVRPVAVAAKTAGGGEERPPATHGIFKLGRPATAAEIAAWDIDIRPDGAGLPVGRGTVADGEPLYTERCAVCHGDFGEGIGRWPVLAGGQDTLTDDRPEKTIGSYWPYLSTVFDYVRRAMPYGDARSLSDDEVYAITAYLLYLNDIVTEEDFALSNENFADIRLPNEANFTADDRSGEAHYTPSTEPCMTDCKPPVSVTMRARILDVTPDADEGVRGAAQVD